MSKAIIYELLNKDIFQVILSQSDVKNIDVQHDVELEGKSTSHQIDVYWEFELNGIIYKTVVQAKDWSKPVNKGELLKFRAVLDDLPGQPKGIFVTRSGYQKGASEVAKANGIALFELREIEKASLKIKQYGYAKGKIISIPISIVGTDKKEMTLAWEFIVYEPEFKPFSIELDSTWLRDKLHLSKAEMASEFSKFEFPKKQPNEHKFYDAEGIRINDLGEIYKSFIEKIREGETKREFCYTFNKPTYIDSPIPEINLFKVLSISVNVTINKSSIIKQYGTSPDIVKFILRNLNTNTETIVGKKKS